MNDPALLQHLEDLTHRLGIELRYDNLGTTGVKCEGGYCVVAGKPIILINRKDSRRRKISVLAKSLRKLNLEGIFIPPAIRKVIETQAV
jgi:hypothetical protein